MSVPCPRCHAPMAVGHLTLGRSLCQQCGLRVTSNAGRILVGCMFLAVITVTFLLAPIIMLVVPLTKLPGTPFQGCTSTGGRGRLLLDLRSCGLTSCAEEGNTTVTNGNLCASTS